MFPLFEADGGTYTPVQIYRYHASYSIDKQARYSVQEIEVPMGRWVPSYLLRFARLGGDCTCRMHHTCTYPFAGNLDSFPSIDYRSIQLYIEHRWENSAVYTVKG